MSAQIASHRCQSAPRPFCMQERRQSRAADSIALGAGDVLHHADDHRKSQKFGPLVVCGSSARRVRCAVAENEAMI